MVYYLGTSSMLHLRRRYLGWTWVENGVLFITCHWNHAKSSLVMEKKEKLYLAKWWFTNVNKLLTSRTLLRADQEDKLLAEDSINRFVCLSKHGLWLLQIRDGEAKQNFSIFLVQNRFWMKVECDTNWSSWIINIIINNSSASFTHLLDAHLLCDTMIVDQCSIQLECIQVSIVAASAIHGFLQEEAINNKVIRYTRLIINIYNSSRAHVIQTSGHALKHLAQVTCRQSSAIPITVAFTAKALLDIWMQKWWHTTLSVQMIWANQNIGKVWEAEVGSFTGAA